MNKEFTPPPSELCAECSEAELEEVNARREQARSAVNDRAEIQQNIMFKAFTLAEVLITLVIIGVIASMTIPSIIQSTQERELKSKVKKTYSTINNALLIAQQSEGCIGDNNCVFGWQSNDKEGAEYFAKYLNTLKVCGNSNSNECKDLYYSIDYYSAYGSGKTSETSAPRIVLADGTILMLYRYNDCQRHTGACTTDENGNCKKDEDGNTDLHSITAGECAIIRFDVNGPKKPNKYGKDCFGVYVRKDKMVPEGWIPVGGNTLNNILAEK